MKRVAIIFLMSALLAPSLHAAEPPLGRLFFTPAQRNTLDAGKQLDRPKTAGPTVQGPRSLTVNGVVTRSDGESTVWVNGGAAGIKRRGAATISAVPSTAAGARVQVEGSTAKLRVGQTLDRTTGKVTESYEARPAARSKPAAADAGQVPAVDSADTQKAADAPAPDNDAARR